MAKSRNLRVKKVVPDTWEEALEQFLCWKKAEGLSNTTLEDYRIHISRLFKRFPKAYQPQKLKQKF